MDIKIVDHPLAQHLLTILRDENTGSEQFRETARRLTYLLLIESTARIPLVEFPMQTPLTNTTGRRLAQPVAAVAVLRAGLGLLGAVIDLLPDVAVGYAGVQRDEETAQPNEYYTKLPDLADSHVLVLEPMLATGGSLSWAVQQVKDAGGQDITALCVVAAPEGVARFQQEHPHVQVVTAALDSHLNQHFYIVPGLGDMGDRLFGTQ